MLNTKINGKKILSNKGKLHVNSVYKLENK